MTVFMEIRERKAALAGQSAAEIRETISQLDQQIEAHEQAARSMRESANETERHIAYLKSVKTVCVETLERRT